VRESIYWYSAIVRIFICKDPLTLFFVSQVDSIYEAL
jgi:hypothetical protein